MDTYLSFYTLNVFNTDWEQLHENLSLGSLKPSRVSNLSWASSAALVLSLTTELAQPGLAVR